jgi:hypothetical protein
MAWQFRFGSRPRPGRTTVPGNLPAPPEPRSVPAKGGGRHGFLVTVLQPVAGSPSSSPRVSRSGVNLPLAKHGALALEIRRQRR